MHRPRLSCCLDDSVFCKSTHATLNTSSSDPHHHPRGLSTTPSFPLFQPKTLGASHEFSLSVPSVPNPPEDATFCRFKLFPCPFQCPQTSFHPQGSGVRGHPGPPRTPSPRQHGQGCSQHSGHCPARPPLCSKPCSDTPSIQMNRKVRVGQGPSRLTPATLVSMGISMVPPASHP